MGLVLGFQAAGFGGIFAIVTDSSASNDAKFVRLLSFVMIVITFALGMVWLREHALAEQYKQKLSAYIVQQSPPGFWQGKTAMTWFGVHLISLIFWISISIASGCFVDYLKN